MTAEAKAGALAGTDSLEAFARANRLDFAPTAELPGTGATLSQDDGRVEGAVTGTLPGGVEGTLARFTYSYRISDDENGDLIEHQQLTLVVAEVPESIGFVPALGFARGDAHLDATAGHAEMRAVDLGVAAELKDAQCFIYSGTDANWAAQLLSPALLEWLSRAESDFGFELSAGVLVVGRDGYLAEARDLTALCVDAAHLAGALRSESEETVRAGGAAAHAAKEVGEVTVGEREGGSGADPRTEAALAAFQHSPPRTLDGSENAFASQLRRSPRTIGRSLAGAAVVGPLGSLFTVVPVLLGVAGAWPALAGYELIAVLVAFAFVYRWAVRDDARRFAREAFFRGYAASHGLTLVDPLRFLATHAEAKVPFQPDRVLSGTLPGGREGALALVGDGSRRADRIAVVAGPAGPIAETELAADAPGLSVIDLDNYLERLSRRLDERK
jgi:hypothetical protein